MKKKPAEKDISSDLLRDFCCFLVVLSHSSVGLFSIWEQPFEVWRHRAVLASFIGFAVPCFYMLSGAYLLQKPQSIRTTLQKRIPKMLLPLLFWSVVFILYSGDIRPQRFVDMFFTEQWSHLWFMYPVLGFYFLLPLASSLYSALGKSGKVYLLLLLCIIPALLYDSENLFHFYVRMPHFAVFWPDLGLFFLGAVLLEYRGKFKRFLKIFPVFFALGWAFTAFGTIALSLRDNTVNKAFISCIGSTGVLCMACSAILFVWGMEDRLQKMPAFAKKLVLWISQTSFGIYLIHPMVMQLWNRSSVPWLPLYDNEGTIPQMFVGAVCFFLLSALVTWSWKRLAGSIRYIYITYENALKLRDLPIPASGRLSAIDGLRGIMALIIALFHFGQVYPLGNMFRRGYFAVEAFFIISGFLLAKQLKRNGQNIHPVREFLHRLRRLYPAYIFSVFSLIMLYSSIWFNWNPVRWLASEPTHTMSLIAEVLCLQSLGLGGFQYINGPAAYVSSLLVATLVLLAARKIFPEKAFKYGTCVSVILIYSVLFVINPEMDPTAFISGTHIPIYPLRGIAGMGLGCGLFWTYEKLQHQALPAEWLNMIARISCVCFVVPLIWTEPSRTNYLLFIPVCVYVLCVSLLGGDGKFPVLNSRPVQYLGKISYSFFLMQSFWQNFTIFYIAPKVMDNLLLNILYAFLNMTSSWLLYVFLEKRVPKMLSKRSMSSEPHKEKGKE